MQGGIFIGQSWFILELYTPDEKEFPYDYTNNSTYTKGEDIIHTNMIVTAEDKFRIEEYNSTSIVDKKEDIFIKECDSSTFKKKVEVIHIESGEHTSYRRDD